MPLLRQRAKRFGQERQSFRAHRELASFRLHDLSLGAHDVAEIQEVHQLVAVLQRIVGQEQLEVAGPVAERDERDLPVFAQEYHSTGNCCPMTALFADSQVIELRVEFGCIRVLGECQGKGLDPLVAQAL